MFSALVLERLWVKGTAISGGDSSSNSSSSNSSSSSSSSSSSATAVHMKTFFLALGRTYGNLLPNASIYVDRLAEIIN
jgi:exo-beta-1,3-glucanase (GH17 family)